MKKMIALIAITMGTLAFSFDAEKVRQETLKALKNNDSTSIQYLQNLGVQIRSSLDQESEAALRPIIEKINQAENQGKYQEAITLLRNYIDKAQIYWANRMDAGRIDGLLYAIQWFNGKQ